MNIIRIYALTATLSSMLICGQAYAFDLNGEWATDASACKHVFGMSAEHHPFIKGDLDSFGGGFIVRGNSIIGKIATCTIIKKKETNDVLHLIAKCSTDVALANVQFSFKINDKSNITRLFPGMEDLNVTYARCHFE